MLLIYRKYKPPCNIFMTGLKTRLVNIILISCMLTLIYYARMGAYGADSTSLSFVERDVRRIDNGNRKKRFR